MDALKTFFGTSGREVQNRWQSRFFVTYGNLSYRKPFTNKAVQGLWVGADFRRVPAIRYGSCSAYNWYRHTGQWYVTATMFVIFANEIRPVCDNRDVSTTECCRAIGTYFFIFFFFLMGGGVKGAIAPPLNSYLMNRLYVRYTLHIFLMWIIL
jgi:hypothetical protein